MSEVENNGLHLATGDGEPIPGSSELATSCRGQIDIEELILQQRAQEAEEKARNFLANIWWEG